MTAFVARVRPADGRAYQATGSTLLTILLSLALLALGYALKTAVEQRGVTVSGAGVTAVAPQGWRAESGSRELVVRHPSDPWTLFAASLVAGDGSDLVQLARDTTLGRGGLYLGFQVTGETPVRLGDRSGQQVRYAYVTSAETSGVARLVQGMDVYLGTGSQVIAVSYEAPSEHFDEDLAVFERFAASVRPAGTP